MFAVGLGPELPPNSAPP
ncbi:hypothetical protein LINPERHAP1_LOCUS36352 [Linum perenne]